MTDTEEQEQWQILKQPFNDFKKPSISRRQIIQIEQIKQIGFITLGLDIMTDLEIAMKRFQDVERGSRARAPWLVTSI